MLVTFLRALIMYAVVCIIIRMMGKREIGQLQPFEFVLALLAADLISTPMGDTKIPLLYGIMPLIALFFAHSVLSFLSMKSQWIRNLVNGTPAVVIQQGKLQEDVMRKCHYNIIDLMEQLRSKDCFSVSEVEYAVLETNGSLSVMLKSQAQTVRLGDMGIYAPEPAPSYTLIYDGSINYQNLYEAGYSKDWLFAQMANYGYSDVKQVFYASVQGKTIFMQGKER